MIRLDHGFHLTAILASAATIRLYMKDGEYQLVREYKVMGDRIRYYSVERGDWEEIPLELADLKKTEAEMKRRDATISEEAAALAAEDAAERELEREVSRVPRDPGVYLVAGDQLKAIPPAESKIVTNRRRSILESRDAHSDGDWKGHAGARWRAFGQYCSSATPEFYIRLSAPQRFGIVKLDEKKGVRVVEKLEIMPVTNQIIEEQNEVAVFRHQVADELYKIWPMKPLEPGQYAVVEYTPALDEGPEYSDLGLCVWSRRTRGSRAPGEGRQGKEEVAFGDSEVANGGIGDRHDGSHLLGSGRNKRVCSAICSRVTRLS
jgi:hypothetical protein